MLTHHSLPSVDEWTYTAQGLPWVAYAWGMGVIFYLIYSAFGGVGIGIFVAGVAVLTVSLLYILLRHLGISKRVSLISVGSLIPVLLTRWPNRPEIVTYPLTIGILLLEELRQNQPKFALVFPIIILAWANLYGSSVLVGLVLLLLFSLRQLWRDRRITPAGKIMYLATAASLATSQVNGYGLQSIFYIFFIPEVAKIQGEWQGIWASMVSGPLEYVLIAQFRALVYLMFIFLAGWVIILNRKKLKNLGLYSLLALSLVLPIIAFRQAPLAAIMAAPTLAFGLSTLSEKVRYTLTLVSAVSVALMIWINPLDFRNIDSANYSSLKSFLTESKLSGRAFTNQQTGSWVSFNFPNILVHSDTRDDLYSGSDILAESLISFANEKPVMPLLDKYKVELVIGNLSDGASYQVLFYSQDWQIVFLQNDFLVAVRKGELSTSLPNLRGIDPYSATAAQKDREQEAEAKLKVASSDPNSSFSDRLRLARVYLGQSKFDQAIEEVNTAAPNLSPIDLLNQIDREDLLVRAYLSKKDCAQTKSHLSSLRSLTQHKLIFQPVREIPSNLNLYQDLYFGLCPLERAQL